MFSVLAVFEHFLKILRRNDFFTFNDALYIHVIKLLSVHLIRENSGTIIP